MDTLLERDQWLKEIASHPEEDFALRKGLLDVIKAIDVENRTVESVISTATVDRDGDTINPKKWNLKNYKKNPIVLFGHSHRDIVGNSKVTVENGKLMSVDQFVPEDFGSPIANLTWNLVAGGFLKAKSVGFKPERGKFEYVEDDERRGYDFNGQELLEHSYVAVPSNPEALVGAKAVGITLTPLIEWAKEILDNSDEGFLYLPRDVVERTLKIAENEPAQFQVPDINFGPVALDSIKELEDQKAIALVKDGDTMVLLSEKEVDPPEGTVTMIDGLFDSEGNRVKIDATNGGGLNIQRSEPESKEPADGEMNDEMFTALLDSSAPAKKENSEDELMEAVAEVVAEQISGTVREAVGSSLTALTGKLD
jgi:hypothetical protein